MERVRALLSAKGRAGWWFYVFIRVTIRSVLYPYFRVNIIGRERLDVPLSGPIPEDGSTIVLLGENDYVGPAGQDCSRQWAMRMERPEEN